MSLQHLRIQRAVGQGFFHTGELREDHGPVFRYVFDCGSMSSYVDQRSKRIAEYRASVPKGTRLDVLFISHAHADHLNGLEQLLKPGLGVDTIVLPLMNVVDRLIAYGRDMVSDGASAQGAFYRDFIVDPAAALGRFGPRRIIFVRARHGDGGAPGSDGEGFDGPDRGRDLGVQPDQTKLGWKLVGRGPGGGSAPQDAASENGVAVDEIDDTQALAIPLQAVRFWLLAPYVDESVEADRALFVRALAKELRLAGGKALAAKVKHLDTADLDEIVKNYTAALAVAYASIQKNLNVTSLCLYSGPARRPSSANTEYYRANMGQWQNEVSNPERVAWLTTGDAALKEVKRRKPFLVHFGELLKQVVTLTLPHHGSDHNFHVELVDEVSPSHLVVSADRYGTWKHPGSTVVQLVASTGRTVSVVTADQRSTAWETVVLR